MNLREWQTAYANGEFDAATEAAQVAAGWTDWVCSIQALASKTKSMAGMITRLRDGGRLDLDANSVAFRNGAVAGGSPYDTAVFAANVDDCEYVVTMDDVRFGDDMKWHVIRNGGMVAAFDTVVKLAKWLNEPEPHAHRVEVQTIPPSDELRAMASKWAMDEFGIMVEYPEIQRRYFHDGEQADIWIGSRLQVTEPGTVLVAIFGERSVIGFTARA